MDYYRFDDRYSLGHRDTRQGQGETVNFIPAAPVDRPKFLPQQVENEKIFMKPKEDVDVEDEVAYHVRERTGTDSLQDIFHKLIGLFFAAEGSAPKIV